VKRVLGFRFATIKGINSANPDIDKVFNMCRVAAEQKGYKMFAIRVRRSSEMFFIPFFVSGVYVIYHIENLSKMTSGNLIGFVTGMYFAKRTKRIRKKRSELFAISFVPHWGILILFPFANFVTPRTTSTTT